jgi:excisionase family DNA binding protein
MQNGSDAQRLGGVTPMVAELLDAPDRVAALSDADAWRALVAVSRIQRDLATLTMMLTVQLGEGREHRAAVATPSVPSQQGALTQADAAEAYRIPLRTLRQLTRIGRIPSYQLGKNRMVLPTDVDRYIARCRAQGVKVGTRLDV